MSCRPPDRAPLNAGRPNEREDELHESRRLERPMGEIAMIKARDREHVDDIHPRRNPYSDTAPADIEDPEAHQVYTEVRNQANNINAVRISDFLFRVLFRRVVEPETDRRKRRSDAPAAGTTCSVPFIFRRIGFRGLKLLRFQCNDLQGG